MNKESEVKKIGAKLKRLRKERGYSSSDTFAYENNLNRSQYGKYEAGQGNPTIDSLVALLNIHGLTFSEFFNEDYEQVVSDKTK